MAAQQSPPQKLDTDWIRQSFILDPDSISNVDMVRRTLSTAAFKFTDTTIGGNFAINPPPQNTRFADIKMGGTQNTLAFRRGTGDFNVNDRNALAKYNSADDDDRGPCRPSPSKGMGRYYSEAIDDNGQYVVMRFGVPEYNSLTGFLGNFYDPSAARVARTGQGPGLFYTAGKAAGLVLALPFWPFIVGGRIVKFLAGMPPSKFYYLKPAMPLYWSAVNKMLNAIAINMGLLPHQLAPELEQPYGNPQAIDGTTAAKYHRMMPDIIGPNGRIDVFAVASKAQRMANQYNEQLRDRLENTSGTLEAITKLMRNWIVNPINDSGSMGLEAYIKLYADNPDNSVQNEKDDNLAVANRDKYNEDTGFWKFFNAERRDGAQFVTFRVDFTNTADETFSNQTKETDLAGKINSMSSSARNTYINFAGGNVSDNMFIDGVEAAVTGAKDLLVGLADGLQVAGLAAIAGGGLVDIPKVWDQASATLPRIEMNIELRSPYGNKLSRLRNLYLPLSMLLAGALPLSAGRHAYTSPFLCEAFCRGRAAIRLGIIESLSVTRGTGNIGWTADGEPLGIDVRATITDLSSIMHMPISSTFKAWEGAVLAAGEAVGGGLGQVVASAFTSSTFDDDNSYTDYMSVLGSLSYQDFVYPTRRWRLNVANSLAEFESMRSPARWANWMMGTWPGRVIAAVSANTDRPQ